MSATAPDAPHGRIRSATMRRAAGVSMLALILVSVLAWRLTRDLLPERIRIATAESGGLYYRFGKLLAAQLEKRCQCRGLVVETRGSVENLGLVEQGQAESAVVQAGSGLLGHKQYQRLKERERQAAMQRDKDHLDDFLEETIRIEKAQMSSEDPDQLRSYLNQVTELKLRALEGLRRSAGRRQLLDFPAAMH